MADLTQEEVDRGVEAAGRAGAEAGAEALKAPGVIKKKKKPGLIEMGKSLYRAYMARRQRMPETMPRIGLPAGGIRRPKPKPEEPERAEAPTPPKKKKKPRGGVGGVLDTIKERERRIREAAGE